MIDCCYPMADQQRIDVQSHDILVDCNERGPALVTLTDWADVKLDCI